MGYTADFSGEFSLDRPLAPEHAAYLKRFAGVRHMTRNPEIAEQMEDPIRIAAGLPIGYKGAYFTGGLGFAGQERDNSIIEDNPVGGGRYGCQPDVPDHETQPGYWCQWVPTPSGDGIEWDGGEKFYEYVAWIEYLIRHFLQPWGYVVNGQVSWSGEEDDDIGVIDIKNNVVRAGAATIVYPSFD